MKGSTMMRTDRPGVLLLGNRRQSLTVIRVLKAAGLDVFIGLDRGDDRDYHAHRSRGVFRVWRHRSWKTDPSGFDAELFELLDRHPEIGAIFPIDESALKRIDALRDVLRQRVGLAIANHDAIRICLNKQAMFEVCEDADVPHRRFEVVPGESLRDACERIGLPCIVKPMDHETLHFGVKADILRTAADLDQLAQNPAMVGRQLMVQRFATGPRHNVYFIAQHGQLVQAVQVRIDRTDRVDGTGLAVAGRTVAPTPALVEDTKKLIASLQYHGVGCAQFLYDGDESQRCFLELNPRLGANFAAVYRAGLKLPQALVRLAYGNALTPPTDPLAYPRGQRFAWSVGSLAGLRFEKRQRTITGKHAAALVGRTLIEAARAEFSTGGHITWSWRDPMPTLLELARPLFKKPTQAKAIVAQGAVEQQQQQQQPGSKSVGPLSSKAST